MKLQSLTNVRPTKDLGTQVIASCTKGQFKITPEAAKQLKVVEGDYADILEDIDTTPSTLYLAKGQKGNGGKLAGQGTLTFSAAVAWNLSKADEDHNTHYNLGEGVTVGEGEDAQVVYPLEFGEKVEKMQRGPKSESTDDSPVSASAVEDEGNSFEEM